MRDWSVLSCFACVVGVQGDTIGMGWDYALALSGAGLALVMIVEAGHKAGEASMLLPACYAILISFA